MVSASNLSEQQVSVIRDWVAQGAQMADIQKRLKEEFGLNATYMDTRFIALDLNLEFVQDEIEEEGQLVENEVEGDNLVSEEEEPSEATIPLEDAGISSVSLGGGDDPSAPSVSVGLDQVAIPGAMVSGTITFSDGERGRWMIDTMGRPSIDPETPNYQPTQADLEDFQVKLKHLFETQM